MKTYLYLITIYLGPYSALGTFVPLYIYARTAMLILLFRQATTKPVFLPYYVQWLVPPLLYYYRTNVCCTTPRYCFLFLSSALTLTIVIVCVFPIQLTCTVSRIKINKLSRFYTSPYLDFVLDLLLLRRCHNTFIYSEMLKKHFFQNSMSFLQ